MEFKVDGLYRTLRYKQTFNHLKIISNHLNKSRLYKNNRYSKRWFRNLFYSKKWQNNFKIFYKRSVTDNTASPRFHTDDGALLPVLMESLWCGVIGNPLVITIFCDRFDVEKNQKKCPKVTFRSQFFYCDPFSLYPLCWIIFYQKSCKIFMFYDILEYVKLENIKVAKLRLIFDFYIF